MNGNRLTRKPDPLLLLAMAVVLGAVLSTSVQAAEPHGFLPVSLQSDPAPTLDENGYRIVRFGKHGAALHVSMSPPPAVGESYRTSGNQQDVSDDLSEVFLSVNLPW